MQRIKFQDKEYILTDGGAITTEESYRNGTVSFAHLGLDSNINRYGSLIGTRKDIEFLSEIPEIKFTEEGISNLLTPHSSWLGKEVDNA